MNSAFSAGNLSGFEQSTGSVSTNSSFWNSTQVMAVPGGCMVLQFSEFLPWDNPDNLISLEAELMTDMIVSVGFLNVLYLISAPTNILNMVVFAKQGLKERIQLCLFFQSLVDLIFITLSFILYLDKLYQFITRSSRRGPISQFILNNYVGGFYAFNWASGFMTMVIATERCFCVLSPLLARRILKTRSMLVIILIAFIVILGGYFLVVTRWNLICVYNSTTKSTHSVVYPSKFYLLHKRLIDALDVYVYGIVLPVVFTLVVSVSTAITVVKLNNMASWREKTASLSTSIRDLSLTRMLIGCSILFVVCNIPGMMFRVLILIVPDFNLGRRYHNTFNVMFTLSELFFYFNCSFNFFVYYSLGTKYKQTLISLCRRKKAIITSPGPKCTYVVTNLQ